jgi:cytochrome c
MRIIVISTVACAALAAFACIVGPATQTLAQGAPTDRLFKQRCAACHSVVAGKAGTIGPNLKGVVGRKSGATAYSYSPAMKRANIAWTTRNLDRYLAGPSRMVPGTKMAIAVPDAAQRAEIVRYLATVK